jgi:cytoskeletal protein CcmA (bactofilin family)
MNMKKLSAALLLATPVLAHAAPFTLFAGKNIALEQGTRVAGDIAAKGNIQAKIGAEIKGNILATGNVTLEQSANVRGDINAGSKVNLNYQSQVGGKVSTSTSDRTAVTLEQGAKVGGTISHKEGTKLTTGIDASHGGEVFTSVTAPALQELPKATTFSAGTTAFNLNAYTSSTLAGGSYGGVNIGYDSTLTLSAGSYYFDSLNVNAEGKFIFDLSGGAINLYIKKDVNIGEKFEFVTLNGSAGDIYTETLGNWNQGSSGAWYGTLFGSGTDSTLHFNQNSTIGGTFLATKNIQLDLNSTVTGLPSQPSQETPGAQVPLPGTLSLMGLGLLALAGLRRRS